MDKRGSRQIDNDWRTSRSWSTNDAIEAALDRLQSLFSEYEPALPPDPTPMSSGLTAFDRVMGGGIYSGEVVVVETPLRSHSLSLLCSLALRADVRTLLDTHFVREATNALLAGLSGVPQIIIQNGELSDADWDALMKPFATLSRLPLFLAEAESVWELNAEVRRRRTKVVLVHDLKRFGPTLQSIEDLTQLARDESVAVVVASLPLGDLPDWSIPATRRVVMAPHAMGSRAALIRPDDHDVLSVVQVTVDVLTSRVY